MFLMKREPTDLYDLFRDFERNIGRMFGEAWRMSRDHGLSRLLAPWEDSLEQLDEMGGSAALRPAVEAFTKDGQLVLRAEVPGVDPEKLEVTLTGKRLTIKGEKREERSSKEGDVHLREIARGRFERSFTLPEEVEPDQIKATYQDGILEVTLPAKKLAEARKIPVATGGKKWLKRGVA